ncbi:THO complex, subunit 5 [Kalmanozyma brasiliensis GHG001]|uniref:Fms interacting protein n=1 Tax=Kalmanozyma brasiliensis (strain GHG001) TaxID=1365824 RepID=V5EPY8_KALBG|nr:THO complex, subunit 5 [Kalmanozyma brasiliensis GHG001]EST05003.1 THO complex, subunit 5 [Kalmanozyma brasiliensis GHG001]
MTSIEEDLKRALASLSEISDLKTAAEEDADASSPEARAAAMQLLTASTPLFSRLKRVNRSIYNDLQSQKSRVAEERAKVDTARLALENLKYEESMLELEVKVCQEFQSIYQDIQLHDEDEFRQLYAASQSDGAAEELAEEDLGDDHKLMLARLRFELRERKRLEAEKQSLQQDKTEVAKENREKKVKLEEIEKGIKELLAGAKGLQGMIQSL